MGDFDKNQPADSSANEKRKQILVGVLGLVLLGVVSFHFLKGSPAKVSASPLAPGGAAPALRQTPRDEIVKLENNPASNLLTAAPVLDPALADIPHDPFRIPDRLKASLTKTEVRPVPTHVDVIPQPAPTAKVVQAGSMKLDGIMRVGKQYNAILNGSIVSAGATVGDAYIVDIQVDRVIVRHKDSPDGPTTSLSIQPKFR